VKGGSTWEMLSVGCQNWLYEWYNRRLIFGATQNQLLSSLLRKRGLFVDASGVDADLGCPAGTALCMNYCYVLVPD
jgi:hypothetical protein